MCVAFNIIETFMCREKERRGTGKIEKMYFIFVRHQSTLFSISKHIDHIANRPKVKISFKVSDCFSVGDLNPSKWDFPSGT